MRAAPQPQVERGERARAVLGGGVGLRTAPDAAVDEALQAGEAAREQAARPQQRRPPHLE